LVGVVYYKKFVILGGMGKIELVEKIVIVPEQSTPRKRMFLSNIDLSLVVYQDSVSFFDPPSTQMSFSEVCNKLYRALSKMLMQYDFMAGRLVPSLEDTQRFEIDCNGAGIVVASARTDRKLSEFGVISAPNPELKELVVFLHEGCGQETDLKEKPLASLQVNVPFSSLKLMFSRLNVFDPYLNFLFVLILLIIFIRLYS